MYKSRKELIESGEINHPPYSYFSQIFESFHNKDKNVRMFHSSVYYVRAALEKRTGVVYPLPYIEKIMKECGK